MWWCTASADEAVQSFAVLCCVSFGSVCVCEAWLLQQKPRILNPRGSLWERKASRTIPVLGACGEIQRSVNLEPLSLLRARDSGQCFTMASLHWEGKEETEGKRMAEGDNRGRGGKTWDVVIGAETAETCGGREGHTVSHNDTRSGLILMILFRPQSRQNSQWISCRTSGSTSGGGQFWENF